jgi:hypothetical protein
MEVAGDALCSNEMGLTGVVYVEPHLLDCIGDVRLRQGEVLENPGQTAMGS